VSIEEARNVIFDGLAGPAGPRIRRLDRELPRVRTI
jgi:hypothetical protein